MATISGPRAHGHARNDLAAIAMLIILWPASKQHGISQVYPSLKVTTCFHERAQSSWACMRMLAMILPPLPCSSSFGLQ